MGPDGSHFFESAGVSTAQVTVRALRASDAAAWDEFVFGTPSATFFHRVGWQAVIERAFGHRTHYLLAESAGSIVGVLPLTEIKSRLFGHSLVSNVFCVYGGIVAVNDRAREALDQAAQQRARDLKVGHLEYRQLTSSQREASSPGDAEWHKQDLYFTFRKAIDPDVEANMLAIPRKQRAMVRKGIKNGLVSELDSTVDRFFKLFADNVKRHGTPALPKRYFALLKEIFGADCEVLTVLHEGKVISSVLSFYFREEVLPYYAGDREDARHLAANDFKYWDLMRRACERGYRVFDYGRSKRGTGQFDFKKNWGFEPQPLHYEYFLVNAPRVPEHNPTNPKYRLFIEMWKRLPTPVANALGPHIVKNLG